MDYEKICEPVRAELEEVNDLILARLHSSVPLINELAAHIIEGGGKRLRPMLVLLSAKACNYSGEGEKAIELATIIEFIHTATLLHDDVVDASNLRRGQETANALWGNEASVLVGDFLYSRAFQMMVHLGSLSIMEILAKATNVITEGEVLQLMHRHNPAVSESIYQQVIYAKTAALFEVATQLGGIIGSSHETHIHALTDYGRHLGMIFQLIDDILDYSSTHEQLGKNPGDDLADGKVTLPFIHAFKHCSARDRSMLEQAIKSGLRENFSSVRNVIESTGGIEYTYALARQLAAKALKALDAIPTSPARLALIGLVDFALERKF